MKKLYSLLMTAMFVMLFSLPATAADNIAAEKALDRLVAENPGVELIFDQDRGAPVMLLKLKVRIDSKASPEKAALEFIKKHQTAFGIKNAAAELKIEKTLKTRKNSVPRFTQHFNGIPVENGEMRVVISKDGFISRIYNQYKALDTISTVPGVNYRDAIATAWKNVYGIEASKISNDKLDRRMTELTISKSGGKTRLAYKIALPTGLLNERRVAWVDAHSGEFLKSQNMVKYERQVDAWMYNPGFDGEQELVRTQINEIMADQETEDDLLIGRTHEVTGCPNNGETINVMGLIEIPVCSQVPLAKADANGDFLYTPIDPKNSGFDATDSTLDEFPEAHMYYHVESIYDYYVNLAQYINAEEPPFVDLNMVTSGKKLKCIVNFQTIDLTDLASIMNPGPKPLVAFDNAFFSPAQGGIMEQFIPGDAIVFGQGSEFDFAYDADIIYHEFTHAVIDTLTSMSSTLIDQYGLRDDPGSMNEGFADFFAATVTGTPGLGEYSGPYLMDKANEPMRSCLNDHTVNDDIIGEIHEDSLPWSAALWAIREEFKVTDELHQDVDAAILSAIVEAPEECTFDVMSQTIAAQIGEWFDEDGETTAYDFAIDAFTQRGLIGANRARPFEKGETLYMAGAASTSELSPYTPGYFQMKINVPAGQKEIFIEFGMAAAGGMGGEAATVNFFGKKDAPVLFQYTQNGGVSNDAVIEAVAKQSESSYEQLDRFIVSLHNEDESELAAGDWYVALGMAGGGSMFSAGSMLYMLKVDYSGRVTCELDSHCEECHTCNDNNECEPIEPECDSDEDCNDETLFCDPDSCYSCQPIPDECRTALDCEACQTCEDGSCVAVNSECEEDSDCDDGYHCEIGTCGGKCEEGAVVTDGDETSDGDETTATCTTKDDCAECQLCVQGACIDVQDECSDDDGCDIGEKCVEGECGMVCQDVSGGDEDTTPDGNNGSSDGSSGGCNGSGTPIGLLLLAAFAVIAAARRRSSNN